MRMIIFWNKDGDYMTFQTEATILGWAAAILQIILVLIGWFIQYRKGRKIIEKVNLNYMMMFIIGNCLMSICGLALDSTCLMVSGLSVALSYSISLSISSIFYSGKPNHMVVPMSILSIGVTALVILLNETGMMEFTVAGSVVVGALGALFVVIPSFTEFLGKYDDIHNHIVSRITMFSTSLMKWLWLGFWILVALIDRDALYIAIAPIIGSIFTAIIWFYIFMRNEYKICMSNKNKKIESA